MNSEMNSTLGQFVLLRVVYFITLIIGFPLWLSSLFIVLGAGYVAFLSDLRHIGPIEIGTSRLQGIILLFAFLTYLLTYSGFALWAHRIKRRPWLPFLLLLVAVSVLGYGVCSWSLTDSNAEQRRLLTYLIGLATPLLIGALAAWDAQASQSDATTEESPGTSH